MKLLKLIGLAVAVVAAMAIVVVFGRQAARAQAQERPLIDVHRFVGGGAALGMSIRDVDDADVRREKLDGRVGAVVEDVQAGGAGARAGIRAGDVVISFDGEKVRSARHLSRLIEETPDGREVEALVVRNGERVTLKATPETPESRFWYTLDNLRGLRDRLPERFELNIPEMRFRDRTDRVFPYMFSEGRGRLGVTVQDLTSQLGEYFGAPRGVLVTGVDEGTPGKAAGLRAGDVITKIDGREVTTSDELRRRLASTTGEVVITLVRDRKEQTVTAKFEEPVEADRRPRVIRRIV
jgi:serine protease Do